MSGLEVLQSSVNCIRGLISLPTPYYPSGQGSLNGKQVVEAKELSFMERMPEYLMWAGVAVITANLAVDFFTKAAIRTLSNLFLFVTVWYAKTQIELIPYMQSFQTSSAQLRDHTETLGGRLEHLKSENDRLSMNIDTLEKSVTELKNMPTEFGKTRDQMHQEIEGLKMQRNAIQNTIQLLNDAISTEGRRISIAADRLENLEKMRQNSSQQGAGTPGDSLV